MSGTITFSAGQIFSGGSTVGGGAVGTVAFTQTGSVSYDLASDPPTVSDLTITKDEAASSASFDSLVVQSVSIESVSTKIVTLNTADLPGTAGIPPGLSLNVTGTLLDVAVVTNGGTFYGTAAEYGTDGDLALVAVDEISVYGFPVNVGAAVLSLGVQTTGSVDETFTPAFTVSCFATGTSIRTARGDVPVEHLAIGDRLALRHGGTAPLVWLGHRDVDCRRHPAPRSVWPVRVRRDAFGPGLPARDLLLSPDHAVFCDGVLIPVRHLLNGTSIVQEAHGDLLARRTRPPRRHFCRSAAVRILSRHRHPERLRQRRHADATAPGFCRPRLGRRRLRPPGHRRPAIGRGACASARGGAARGRTRRRLTAWPIPASPPRCPPRGSAKAARCGRPRPLPTPQSGPHCLH